jgi:hypothetical protein
MIEEQVFVPGDAAMDVDRPHDNLVVARPCLPYALTGGAVTQQLRTLLGDWLVAQDVRPAILWYTSPGALAYSAQLSAAVTVYDCGDDEAGLAVGHPALLRHLEQEMVRRADVIFTRTSALHARQRLAHPHVYAIPDGEAQHAYRLAPPDAPERDTDASCVRVRSWDAIWRDVERTLLHVAGHRPPIARDGDGVQRAPLPGDRPGEQGPEDLQRAWLESGTERGLRGQEARLERGAQP